MFPCYVGKDLRISTKVMRRYYPGIASELKAHVYVATCIVSVFTYQMYHNILPMINLKIKGGCHNGIDVS